MDSYAIDVAACRARQQRLIDEMQQHNLEMVVLTQNAHVQYLSGVRYPWTFSPTVALTADGKLTLVAPNKAPEKAAADEVLTYEAQWHSTMRNDQRAASSKVFADWYAGQGERNRLGVEFSSFPQHLSQTLAAELHDIEPAIYRMRRRKDSYELALLRKAIAGTAKMYEVARQLIEPGVNELMIFNELQAAAVEEFGEMLTGTGNDYRCGARGGPPRDRTALDGELYILDLGPAFRGYFADNCRTIAVNDNPTDEQQAAWEAIMAVFQHIESTAKPGKSCKELFEEVQAMLDKAPYGVFNHHLGHGIGLFPHEGPHLNPNWDDTFEVGDVFTCEPGLYADVLNVGMRLENDYLITDDGVELLTDFPIEL